MPLLALCYANVNISAFFRLRYSFGQKEYRPSGKDNYHVARMRKYSGCLDTTVHVIDTAKRAEIYSSHGQEGKFPPLKTIINFAENGKAHRDCELSK